MNKIQGRAVLNKMQGSNHDLPLRVRLLFLHAARVEGIFGRERCRQKVRVPQRIPRRWTRLGVIPGE